MLTSSTFENSYSIHVPKFKKGEDTVCPVKATRIYGKYKLYNYSVDFSKKLKYLKCL